MNKRIKLKKGILKKQCNNNCINYKIITDKKLVTSNICIGCKHKSFIERICDQNMKKELFRCKECGSKMEWHDNGEPAPNDEEWLECNKCGETRELTIEEIDYDTKMKCK